MKSPGCFKSIPETKNVHKTCPIPMIFKKHHILLVGNNFITYTLMNLIEGSLKNFIPKLNSTFPFYVSASNK